MKKIVTTILIAFTLVSCGTDKSETTKEEQSKVAQDPMLEMFNDLTLPGSDGVFRNVELDMTMDEVRKIELKSSKCYEEKAEKEGQLKIVTDLGMKSLNFANIKYQFDKSGLYALHAEVYTTSSKEALFVFDKVRSYYKTSLGGENLADDGFYEYQGERNHKYQVAIKLIDLAPVDDLKGTYGMDIIISLK